jgi:hypothetical protein
MPTEPTSEGDLVSQILTLVGEDPGAFEPSGSTLDLFRRASKKQLVDCAQRLGLTGVAKLAKDELAARIQVAFEAARGPLAPTDGEASVPLNGGGSFPQKFDLGPGKETAVLPENIPWGYGHDRVTAMVVDPDRLFVYWEVTDDAIAAARTRLGRGGPGAWLDLRVYDITGRLFDGTNAHSYFDHRLERHDRQWFFTIGKPTSAACVEVGLRSEEGYFAKLARSGRVEFPRREPVGGGAVDWLSVRTASGPVGAPMSTTGAFGVPPGAPGAPPPGPGAGGGAGEGLPGGLVNEGWREWAEVEGVPTPGGQRLFGRRWQWQEADGTEWTSDLARTEWVGPVLRTEWESGPFAYPVEAPSLVEVRDTGELTIRTEGGLTHVMYGPWQVVIRGIGARAERRVLATWEYKRRVEVTGGLERSVFARGTLAPGSSEWMALGASERAWMGASELLYRGGSELWLLGASELLLRGASETMFAGASEYRLRGASERLQRGASELVLRGASERRIGGASETMFAGASERARGGASELYIGASERFGASERRLGASEQLQGGAGERPGGGEPGGREPPRGGDARPEAPTPGSPYPWPGAMAETD